MADPHPASSLTFSLQALLHRHESYMAEAQDDRRRLLSSIDALEHERHDVHAENARIAQENRALVDELDALNSSLADSDAQVNSLTVALEHTEAELRGVSVAAARAAALEVQLVQMETEQARMHEDLQGVQEDEKSAVQRWKRAEATLREVYEQVDQMEREARDERERHAEVVQRMQRRRTVERELDGAAGRLKGAAAAHELGRHTPGGNVVSRFVRDILQDNANLQIGVMELRDLLESSNEEVQALRDQALSHHPDVDEDQERPSSARPAKRLSQELESDRRVSPEYHIHHHYHPLSLSKKDKPKMGRRLSKKRRSLGGSPAMMHSASHLRQSSEMSSTSTILSQTSASVPPSRRWSSATESLASSPNSGYHYHPTSIFDRVERGCESSQPTSPESTTVSSPMFASRGKTLGPPFQDGLDRVIDDELTNLETLPDRTVPAIPEEREDLFASASYMMSDRPRTPNMFASHESLFSVAGMDIHTPTRRPSRLRDLHKPSVPMHSRRNFSTGGEVSMPVISTSTVTADREAPKPSQQSPRKLLVEVCRQSNDADAPAPPVRKSSLSRRVGGWVRGRWSSTDTKPSNEESLSSQPQPKPQSQTPESSATASLNKLKECGFRHPGVNQKGPIPGFRTPPRAPTVVQPEVDEGLLRESLAE